MEVIDLFKDALKYPTKNWRIYLILGVLFILGSLYDAYQQTISTFTLLNWQPDLIYIAFLLLYIITMIIIGGYAVSIIRKTLALEEDLPAFEWGANIIDGIKLSLLSIVYYIIPFVVTLIVGFATGAFNQLAELMNHYIVYGSLNTIPHSVLNSAAFSFLTTFIIGAILFIIFTLLLNIAIGRLAETDSLIKSMNMISIFNKIGEIGWANYIIWILVFIGILIIMGILIFIISFIIAIILTIIAYLTGTIQLFSESGTILGIFLGAFLISPYFLMFQSKALGLLYNESKK